MKFVFTLVLFLSSVAAISAQATKVGVVDPNTVIQQSKKGKAFFTAHQAFITQKRNELNKDAEAIRTKQKDLQAIASTMSEESKREEAAKLQRMERDLKRKQEDSQAEVTRRLNAKLESMQKEIAPLVRQVAKEKGLNLVLLNNPNTGIFYFDSTIDITNDVIKKYDEMQAND